MDILQVYTSANLLSFTAEQYTTLHNTTSCYHVRFWIFSVFIGGIDLMYKDMPWFLSPVSPCNFLYFWLNTATFTPIATVKVQHNRKNVADWDIWHIYIYIHIYIYTYIYIYIYKLLCIRRSNFDWCTHCLFIYSWYIYRNCHLRIYISNIYISIYIDKASNGTSSNDSE